jgi:hypothetical protein
VIAETARLSAQGAAEELNRRGIVTAGGRQWHAMQIQRARRHVGLYERGVRVLGVNDSGSGRGPPFSTRCPENWPPRRRRPPHLFGTAGMMMGSIERKKPSAENRRMGWPRRRCAHYYSQRLVSCNVL